MSDFRQRVETTYADLRPTDLVIDKTGKAWPIDDMVTIPGDSVNFWLLDPVTKVRQHYMTRLAEQTVTVSRVPTQADEAAKLEAEFLEASGTRGDEVSAEALSRATVDNFATMEEAVAAVEEIGGTVEAEVTAEEVDATHAATDDSSVRLPTFESMTPLEQRSHLYLLHGVFAADLKSRDELAAMHKEAHAGHEDGRLKSAYVPHTHGRKRHYSDHLSDEDA